MRLLSALVSSTATVTAAALATTYSSSSVIVVALDPIDALALSSPSRWDDTNDAKETKETKGDEVSPPSSGERTKTRYLRRGGVGSYEVAAHTEDDDQDDEDDDDDGRGRRTVSDVARSDRLIDSITEIEDDKDDYDDDDSDDGDEYKDDDYKEDQKEGEKAAAGRRGG